MPKILQQARTKVKITLQGTWIQEYKYRGLFWRRFYAGSSHSPRLTLPRHSALSKWYFFKEVSQANIVPATITLSKSLPTRSHCLFFPHLIICNAFICLCVPSSPPECKVHEVKDFIRLTAAYPAFIHSRHSINVSESVKLDLKRCWNLPGGEVQVEKYCYAISLTVSWVLASPRNQHQNT